MGTPVYDVPHYSSFVSRNLSKQAWVLVTKFSMKETFVRPEFDYKSSYLQHDKIFELLEDDAGIIHQTQSIFGCNQRANFIKTQEFGSFSNMFVEFTDGKPLINNLKTLSVPATTRLSDKISKRFKKGLKFILHT
jgi:3-methyladenine DNA glycosylase Tag